MGAPRPLAATESMTVRVYETGAQEAGSRYLDEGHHSGLAWREALNEAILNASGDLHLDWNKGAERPYFTDKPPTPYAPT